MGRAGVPLPCVLRAAGFGWWCGRGALEATWLIHTQLLSLPCHIVAALHSLLKLLGARSSIVVARSGDVGGWPPWYWGAHLTEAWTWTSAQAASGHAFVLQLPATCKLATVHAALVCAGQTPEYVVIPGFAPLSHSWGWLIVGVLVGILVTISVMSLSGCLRREPTIGALAAIALAPQPPAARAAAPALRAPPGLVPQLPPLMPRARQEAFGWGSPQARAREDVLTYLTAGGAPALQELASASGVSDSEFLVNMFGARATY